MNVAHPRRDSHPTARLYRRDPQGVATVWAITWMAVLVVLASIGGLLGVAASRQHHVDAAADLVAISAAARLQRGGDACSMAMDVAIANRVVLARCRVAGRDVVVEVRERLTLPFDLHPWISGQARAGPR